jgi:CPA2 family monovalent cation:H+ antiporter-2
MLFDPRSLIQAPMVIGMVLVVVIIGKPLAAVVTVRALGTSLETAIPVGAAFSQVGEFSFILGTVARGLGLINDAGWNALVAASIISIALNPSIYRTARRLSSKTPRLIPGTESRRQVIDPNRCILVGYGPVGKIVHRLLTDRGAELMTIDLNLETVRLLREQGFKALYADALRPETLEEAVFLADRVVVMTPRPGRVRTEIAVPLSRPRTHAALVADPTFNTLKADVLAALGETN